MTAYNFPPGFSGLPTGEELNSLAGATGATGPTGPTGPAFSTAGPTFTGTTTVAALTATGAVVMSNASITIANLPTSDPSVAGRLYTTAGAIKVSAG